MHQRHLRSEKHRAWGIGRSSESLGIKFVKIRVNSRRNKRWIADYAEILKYYISQISYHEKSN